MKKKHKLGAAILIIMIMLVGCGNKIDDPLSDNPVEFSMETNSNNPEDSYGTTSNEEINNNEETPDAEDTFEEVQTSPFTIWEYEGYVDECDGYTWQEEFFDCDYDGDGKNDRVKRSWDGGKQTAIYEIEFGNGDKLTTPDGPETGFPHIQAGDLDGDGAKEILIILTYDTSTDPYSFGDMWLFDRDKDSGEYAEVELPLVKDEYGGKGFNVDYDKPQDNKIRFTLREAGLSMTEEVDADYLSNWWTDDLSTQLRVVFYAEIIDNSKPVLRCYLEPLHRWGPMLGFNLNYVGGEYKIGYIERDTPDSWG
ncbi:MAG: VCBS repeat-containing protein [Butyrivibrio sp.]|nr:VCBS repeat-containing protein [Butyrivibrio sp.]